MFLNSDLFHVRINGSFVFGKRLGLSSTTFSGGAQYIPDKRDRVNITAETRTPCRSVVIDDGIPGPANIKESQGAVP